MSKVYTVVLLIFLSGCGFSPYLTTSDYDSSGDFNRYTSFKVLSNNELDQSSQEVLTQAITTRLSSMGYFNAQKPSFFINYHIVKGKFKVRTFNQTRLAYFLSAKDYHQQQNQKSEIEKISGSTLVISIFDTQTDKVVWRGLSVNESEYTSYRDLVYSVNVILDEYIIAKKSDKTDVLF